MMKRLSCALLSCLLLCALLISGLTVPASAVTKVRVCSGFSDIPSVESPYFGPVKSCYEAGLLNGSSETVFGIRDPLSIAQLVVICARLYNIQQGGKGEIPDLPDFGQPFLRLCDDEGKEIAAFTDSLVYNAAGKGVYISVSDTAEPTALPETCVLKVGFEGYNQIRVYEGVKESHETVSGVMNQGLVGTGYRFADPNAASFTMLPSAETIQRLKAAWWFPAAFYLASEGCLNISGDLIYRANSEHTEDYDPLTGFSAPASRALFAWLVDAAAGELPVLNETAGAPDVTEETADGDAILRLYRAGVLTGVDESGTFMGSAPLTRGQAAILLDRVIDPAARKGAV